MLLYAKDGREDQKKASRWKSEDVHADHDKFRGLFDDNTRVRVKVRGHESWDGRYKGGTPVI